MVGDTILIKDISINGNDELKTASDLSKELTDKTINALGIDASSRTIWINGQPYGNAYVNIKGDDNIEKPIGGEIFNDFTNNVASGEFSHAEGKGTVANNEAEHAEGKYNKSNNTIHSVGIGTSDNDRKNAEEIHYDSGDKYVIGIGGYDGTNSTNTTVKTVQAVVNESINQITISYLKLKELRDASQLVPGKEYRINDYTCTTTQPGTRSAGNVFDIIVTADSESTLNEEARAIRNDNDNNYFKDCDLNAWKLWYCLDNDTTRFAWADETNGKGVIYRMIDEWNNDVPYDFKNIQYNGSWGYWAYTFNWINDEGDNSYEDLSVAQYAHTNYEGGYSHTYDNVIKPCELGEANYGVPFKLNACVFLNTESYEGGTFHGCYNNAFGNNCCHNTFGNWCNDNTFGNGCSNNTFGNGCSNNTFGNGCSNNFFGIGCYNNSFGNGCSHNAFGNNCQYNTFGENCYRNSFGENCYRNSFGENCYRNSFGAHCDYNSVGNCCDYIIFAVDSSASTKYDYYRHNHFGDGCEYILFMGKDIDVDYQRVQNYNFAQGVQGTDSAYLTIDGVRNRAYETYISRDTDGTIKESVIADKLDKMIEITYKELYDLRKNSRLIPGQQYRITDYNCTTKQENTKSAGHVFDIIVTADSKNKLNEEARAIQHTDYDTDYFAKCNLSAWKLWYCLDNDKDRFGWALGDERILGITFSRTGNSYYVRYEENKVINGVEYALWYYDETHYIGTTTLNIDEYCTFFVKNVNDLVEITSAGDIYISDNTSADAGKGVIYRMIDEWNNDCPYDFKNIQFNDVNYWGYWAYTFNWINDESDNSCEDLSVEQYAHKNEANGYSQTYGNVIKPYGKDIHSNSSSSFMLFMLNKCVFLNTESYNNGTYRGCYSNAIGDECHDNIFGNGCCNNTLGNGCYSNAFGNECTDNSFGCGCYENMVRDYSSFNTFGKECHYIYLGQSCFYNTFGNDCQQIHFEENKTSKITKFYKNNRFGDGCSLILFGQTNDGDISNYVKNYIFAQGTRSFNTTGDVYLHIDGERNRNYETYVGFTSRSSKNSDLQQKCLLDIFL